MREIDRTILGGKPEDMDKARLVEILDREIAKETPDDDVVLAVLGELKRRDTDRPVELTEGQKKLWQAHEKKIRKRENRSLHILPTGMVRAAVAVLVLSAVVLLAVPTSVNAGSLWKIVASWTADIFRYENIGGETEAAEETGFRTDNTGLQQVYDALGELGIEPRPVPQWLPEGYVLEWIDIIDTDAQCGINAGFSNGETEIVLDFRKMEKDLSPDYDKEDADVIEYECDGIFYNMIENSENWTINWTVQNLKCFVTVDCQEDVVIQIIRSIY